MQKIKVANPVVVQFMVDGIDHNSVRTAVANGATTLGTLLKQGTTAATYYCTSPAARLDLPDGSRPWGGSTSSNVAMHTGTHLFESYNIDDIFLSARRAGISPAPRARCARSASRTTKWHAWCGTRRSKP